MFFYIYKVEKKVEYFSNISSEFKDTLDDINFEISNVKFNEIKPLIKSYKFTKQKEVTGNLVTERVELNLKTKTKFIIRFKSGFCFIETDKKSEKVNAFKCLNKWLNQVTRLTDFIPRRDKIIHLINEEGTLNSAKLFTGRGIVDIEDLSEREKDSKEDLLMKYPLSEADFELNLNNDPISIYYYGDALQFPAQTSNEKLKKALQIFENIMSEEKNHNSKNHIPKTAFETC